MLQDIRMRFLVYYNELVGMVMQWRNSIIYKTLGGHTNIRSNLMQCIYEDRSISAAISPIT